MGDTYPKVRVACIQAASEFLDREGTVEKACRLIREAGELGAEIIAFPEGFIPGHPLWYHFKPATDPSSSALAARLVENSVTIPSPATDALCEAAKEAGAYVVMGLAEKLAGTFGTLYNSQLFIAPDGSILGKHQKLTPTVGERLVHTGGYGDTLGPIETKFGKLGGLICGESSNPLIVFTLLAQYTMINVISWPNRFPKKGMSCPERAMLAGRSVAVQTKSFVLNPCGTMTDEMRDLLAYAEEDHEILADRRSSGGSSIIGPKGNVVAGPMGPEEGILWADIDLRECIEEKVRHDFGGHYNRADVFTLVVNRERPTLLALEGQPGAVDAKPGHG